MQVTYPGVYVREIPSGVRTVTGVSTSVALFVGEASRGPLDEPVRVTSYAELVRRFGASPTRGELPQQVRQFFLNGGQECWVVRVGERIEPAYARVDLRSVDDVPVLRLLARDAGREGVNLRVEVDYDTAAPDRSFNLTLYREVVDAGGNARREDVERHEGLEMRPDSARFVVDALAGRSRLVVAELIGAAAGTGVSASDRFFTDADAALRAAIEATGPGGSGTRGSLRVRVGASPLLLVRLELPAGDALVALQGAINTALASHTDASVTVASAADRPLEIRAAGADVVIERGDADDLTAALGLGLGQGGVEVGAHAARRPAPSGLVWPAPTLAAFVGATLAPRIAELAVVGTQRPVASIVPAYEGAAAPSFSRFRADLEAIARAAEAAGRDHWSASVRGGRLHLRALGGDANAGFGHTLVDRADAATPLASADAAAFGLRSTEARLRPGVGYQSRQLGTDAVDPGPPRLEDYEAAFEAVERSVDLFNLLVLPRSVGNPDGREQVWGAASVFCERQRALLLVDPPRSYESREDVVANVAALRRGLATTHAAVYWPRVRLDDGAEVDPAGSIAGLMARTDASRGVWKAPAGTEATLRGVRGTRTPMSDVDNGLVNPQAVNAIRIFPTGVVAWGARTMAGFDNSGEDDYRYVPVRRLALFIEESLYRGLRFAVFEPNDEPLWRQIRLAAGAFMANLYRRGAFAGRRAEDAYYVKCDAETTTANDVNLGVVNVLVGFAPLKPAEFVVLQLQQIAGQVQV